VREPFAVGVSDLLRNGCVKAFGVPRSGQIAPTVVGAAGKRCKELFVAHGGAHALRVVEEGL
jgi:hypothetical protein